MSVDNALVTYILLGITEKMSVSLSDIRLDNKKAQSLIQGG